MAVAAAVLHGIYGILVGAGFLLLVLAVVLGVVALLSRRRFDVLSPGDGVLITGASTGIGRACALELVERGFVVFAGVRKAVDGDALVQAVATAEAAAAAAARGAASTTTTTARAPPSKGGVLIPVMLDVAKPEQIAQAARTIQEETRARGVSLRGLINNAGVTGGADPLEFLSLDRNRTVMEVNFFGALACCHAFLPMIRPARGRIVNMSR